MSRLPPTRQAPWKNIRCSDRQCQDRSKETPARGTGVVSKKLFDNLQLVIAAPVEERQKSFSQGSVLVGGRAASHWRQRLSKHAGAEDFLVRWRVGKNRLSGRRRDRRSRPVDP